MRGESVARPLRSTTAPSKESIVTVCRFYPAALTVAISLQAHTAGADVECSRIRRENVVTCALRASLSTQSERRTLEAASAREEAARTVLPSNPVLSGWVARRSASVEGTDVNWSATLAQELEIGGQRGLRRREAGYGRQAQSEVVRATERDAAADALRTYFETIAAREQLSLAKDLSETARRVAQAARGAAAHGVIAGVDADVADAALVAVEDSVLARQSRARESNATLAALLGAPPSADVSVEGTLAPLLAADEIAARGVVDSVRRPEVQALVDESRAERARADVYRRERIPNPTLSVFVERDGFAEHVLGAGLALPIPLPHPLGRTYAGEIAESEALSRAAATRAAAVEREARASSARALARYNAARLRVALYDAARTARARESLARMAAEIEAGRLAVRDAVLAQEALIELLVAALSAQEELCVASVDLARSAGVALERGTR
jgi:cobalt-zinc-cadmium efflux system outer membrane protein